MLRLNRVLGSGATSVVWLASDGEQELTLKIGRSAEWAPTLGNEALHCHLALSPRLPTPIDLGRLVVGEGEARVLAEGAGADDAVPFVAFAWKEGEPLAPTRSRRRSERALEVARDVGEALADLHDAGLAHGDVKPENILCDSHGRFHLVDLGLARLAADERLTGGTPRYLATKDAELGTARARDMLALGIVVAEVAKNDIAEAADSLARARTSRLPPAIATIVGALLAPSPGARPAARWVHELASSVLAGSSAPDEERVARWRRSVRASYLRLRHDEIAFGQGATDDVAKWLVDAVHWSRRARAIRHVSSGDLATRREPRGSGEPALLGPLDIIDRRRWLVALVGHAAADWPADLLVRTNERDLAERLEALATHTRPVTWTRHDLERALLGSHEDAGGAVRVAPQSVAWTKDGLAQLALRVGRLPTDMGAVELVERDAERVPESLRLAAADALRLAGHHGRARSLVINRGRGAPIVADILRRSGDAAEAAAMAEQILRDGGDVGDRARGCLARLRFDRGELDGAWELVAGRRSAAAKEIAALVEMARGNVVAARSQAELGLAYADAPEARARLAAVIAYARSPFASGGTEADAHEAREGFRVAVEHAQAACAVLEEATYRTGEAAACATLGQLDDAIDTALRAALLWEDVLERPAMAARAWQAAAAAHAAVGASHEAVALARRAIHAAESAGDTRAEAFGWWAIADVSPVGSEEGITAADRAQRLLPEELSDERLHALARVWLHDENAVNRTEIDVAARSEGQLSAYSRMTWWWARAERLLAERAPSSSDTEMVLSEMLALTDAPGVAIVTRARAMWAAAELARSSGDAPLAGRFSAAQKEAASHILVGCRRRLSDATHACAWLRERSSEQVLRGDEAVLSEMGTLVRTLGERDDLDALLDRILTVLLTWTRAERAIIFLRGPDGSLTPRGARNINAEQLAGDQLEISRSLAAEAVETGRHVIAVDAQRELSKSHHSVHALRLRSVLVWPLIADGEVVGVVYLDNRFQEGAFGSRDLTRLRAVAPLAASSVVATQRQHRLRQALDRVRDAQERTAAALATTEVDFHVVRGELAHDHRSHASLQRFGIIGDSRPLLDLLGLVDRVAPSDASVMIRGESGSGKELVARAIHQASLRQDGQFIALNCGAMPDALLESTLFGHAAGAFTDAHRAQEGLLRAADGGTVLLDEVGEMSLSMQTKLLRVLDEQLVRPVGETATVAVDVRIIAATNRNLEEMVRDGRFREDLYYRLNVVTLKVPALRERRDDIPLLVTHFLSKHAGDRKIGVTPRAWRALEQSPWPGNVRQLENELRRAIVLADDQIDVEHLTVTGESAKAPTGDELLLRERVDALETELVAAALEQTRGNQTKAAELLGLSRFGLHKMMKRLSIRR